MSSPARLSVCRLFVRPTQAIKIFGNFSTPFDTLATRDIQVKFYGDRPRRTLRRGRGVAEYSDFGAIERHISETVQDRS